MKVIYIDLISWTGHTIVLTFGDAMKIEDAKPEFIHEKIVIKKINKHNYPPSTVDVELKKIKTYARHQVD